MQMLCNIEAHSSKHNLFYRFVIYTVLSYSICTKVMVSTNKIRQTKVKTKIIKNIKPNKTGV